jgi:photosystem II stability/assembly factor-like uncharacterized protein
LTAVAGGRKFVSVQSHRHRLLKASAVGLMLLSLAGSAAAQVWMKTSAPNKSWVTVASSADGNKLAAAFQTSGGIYISTNAGATWSLTSAPAKYWQVLASSADGRVLLAAATYNGTAGGIYTSTNYGSTWVSNSVVSQTSYQWDAAAASADGHTLIVGGNTWSPLCVSTNTGATWSTNGVPIAYWTSVACSGDGTKLAADWGGTLYTSTNAGATWANNTPGGSSTLVSSADASHLFVYGSGMMVSTNWGVNWQSGSQPNGYMQMAASSDAKRLVGLYAGNVYLSTDFGATWNTSYAPNKTWKAIGLSADASKMVAVPSSSSDGIYVWQPPVLSSTNVAGNLVFSWPTNGTSFTLQVNPDMSPANWVNATNVPVVTNSLKQVVITPAGCVGFYRLNSP